MKIIELNKFDKRKIAMCVFMVALIIISSIPAYSQEDPCQTDPNSAECQQKKIEETIKSGDVKTLTPDVVAKNLDLIISNNRVKDLNDNQLAPVILSIINKNALSQLSKAQVKTNIIELGKNPDAVKQLKLEQLQDLITSRDYNFFSNIKNLKDLDATVRSALFRDGFKVQEKNPGQLTQFMNTVGGLTVDGFGRLFLNFPVQICQGQNPGACTQNTILQLGPQYTFELAPPFNTPKFIMQSGGVGCTGGEGGGVGSSITGAAVASTAKATCALASVSITPGSVSIIKQKDGFYTITLANGVEIKIAQGDVLAISGNELRLKENTKIIFSYNGFETTLTSHKDSTTLTFDTTKNLFNVNGPAEFTGTFSDKDLKLVQNEGETTVQIPSSQNIYVKSTKGELTYGNDHFSGNFDATYSKGNFEKGTLNTKDSYAEIEGWQRVTSKSETSIMSISKEEFSVDWNLPFTQLLNKLKTLDNKNAVYLGSNGKVVSIGKLQYGTEKDELFFLTSDGSSVADYDPDKKDFRLFSHKLDIDLGAISFQVDKTDSTKRYFYFLEKKEGKTVVRSYVDPNLAKLGDDDFSIKELTIKIPFADESGNTLHGKIEINNEKITASELRKEAEITKADIRKQQIADLVKKFGKPAAEALIAAAEGDGEKKRSALKILEETLKEIQNNIKRKKEGAVESYNELQRHRIALLFELKDNKGLEAAAKEWYHVTKSETASTILSDLNQDKKSIHHKIAYEAKLKEFKELKESNALTSKEKAQIISQIFSLAVRTQDPSKLKGYRKLVEKEFLTNTKEYQIAMAKSNLAEGKALGYTIDAMRKYKSDKEATQLLEVAKAKWHQDKLSTAVKLAQSGRFDESLSLLGKYGSQNPLADKDARKQLKNSYSQTSGQIAQAQQSYLAALEAERQRQAAIAAQQQAIDTFNSKLQSAGNDPGKIRRALAYGRKAGALTQIQFQSGLASVDKQARFQGELNTALLSSNPGNELDKLKIKYKDAKTQNLLGGYADLVRAEKPITGGLEEREYYLRRARERGVSKEMVDIELKKISAVRSNLKSDPRLLSALNAGGYESVNEILKKRSEPILNNPRVFGIKSFESVSKSLVVVSQLPGITLHQQRDILGLQKEFSDTYYVDKAKSLLSGAVYRGQIIKEEQLPEGLKKLRADGEIIKRSFLDLNARLSIHDRVSAAITQKNKEKFVEAVLDLRQLTSQGTKDEKGTIQWGYDSRIIDPLISQMQQKPEFVSPKYAESLQSQLKEDTQRKVELAVRNSEFAAKQLPDAVKKRTNAEQSRSYWSYVPLLGMIGGDEKKRLIEGINGQIGDAYKNSELLNTVRLDALSSAQRDRLKETERDLAISIKQYELKESEQRHKDYVGEGQNIILYTANLGPVKMARSALSYLNPDSGIVGDTKKFLDKKNKIEDNINAYDYLNKLSKSKKVDFDKLTQMKKKDLEELGLRGKNLEYTERQIEITKANKLKDQKLDASKFTPSVVEQIIDSSLSAIGLPLTLATSYGAVKGLQVVGKVWQTTKKVQALGKVMNLAENSIGTPIANFISLPYKVSDELSSKLLGGAKHVTAATVREAFSRGGLSEAIKVAFSRDALKGTAQSFANHVLFETAVEELGFSQAGGKLLQEFGSKHFSKAAGELLQNLPDIAEFAMGKSKAFSVIGNNQIIGSSYAVTNNKEFISTIEVARDTDFDDLKKNFESTADIRNVNFLQGNDAIKLEQRNPVTGKFERIVVYRQGVESSLGIKERIAPDTLLGTGISAHTIAAPIAQELQKINPSVEVKNSNVHVLDDGKIAYELSVNIDTQQVINSLKPGEGRIELDGEKVIFSDDKNVLIVNTGKALSEGSSVKYRDEEHKVLKSVTPLIVAEKNYFVERSENEKRELLGNVDNLATSGETAQAVADAIEKKVSLHQIETSNPETFILSFIKDKLNSKVIGFINPKTPRIFGVKLAEGSVDGFIVQTPDGVVAITKPGVVLKETEMDETGKRYSVVPTNTEKIQQAAIADKAVNSITALDSKIKTVVENTESEKQEGLLKFEAETKNLQASFEDIKNTLQELEQLITAGSEMQKITAKYQELAEKISSSEKKADLISGMQDSFYDISSLTSDLDSTKTEIDDLKNELTKATLESDKAIIAEDIKNNEKAAKNIEIVLQQTIIDALTLMSKAQQGNIQFDNVDIQDEMNKLEKSSKALPSTLESLTLEGVSLMDAVEVTENLGRVSTEMSQGIEALEAIAETRRSPPRLDESKARLEKLQRVKAILEGRRDGLFDEFTNMMKQIKDMNLRTAESMIYDAHALHKSYASEVDNSPAGKKTASKTEELSSDIDSLEAKIKERRGMVPALSRLTGAEPEPIELCTT